MRVEPLQPKNGEIAKKGVLGQFHGLVVPLCGRGWDKLDWDRFHRGNRACPATRTGLQRAMGI